MKRNYDLSFGDFGISPTHSPQKSPTHSPKKRKVSVANINTRRNLTEQQKMDNALNIFINRHVYRPQKKAINAGRANQPNYDPFPGLRDISKEYKKTLNKLTMHRLERENENYERFVRDLLRVADATRESDSKCMWFNFRQKGKTRLVRVVANVRTGNVFFLHGEWRVSMTRQNYPLTVLSVLGFDSSTLIHIARSNTKRSCDLDSLLARRESLLRNWNR